MAGRLAENEQSADGEAVNKQPMVVIYAKTLEKRPVSPAAGPVKIVPFQGETDIDRWLAVQNDAFRGSRPAGREWNRAWFLRELCHKPQWNPAHLWLAEIGEIPAGAIYLATFPGQTTGNLQWLAVRAEFQRQGVATALITHLECAAFDEGVTTIRLETLSTWTAAVRLYERLGYQPSSR